MVSSVMNADFDTFSVSSFLKKSEYIQQYYRITIHTCSTPCHVTHAAGNCATKPKNRNEAPVFGAPRGRKGHTMFIVSFLFFSLILSDLIPVSLSAIPGPLGRAYGLHLFIFESDKRLSSRICFIVKHKRHAEHISCD